MKRPLVFLALGGAALVLQMTVLDVLPFGALKPDLVLLLLLYLSGRSDAIPGGLVAFALGYAMDVLSGAPFGLFTVTKVVIYFLGYLAAKRVYLTAGLAPAVMAVVATVVEGLLLRVLYGALGLDGRALGHGLLRYLVFQALLMGALAPFLFHWLGRLDAWLGTVLSGADDRRSASLL
ncbi:MAG TPA: rod shape-determining protein MreD [Thermodesulfobacteriota bacterium]